MQARIHLFLKPVHTLCRKCNLHRSFACPDLETRSCLNTCIHACMHACMHAWCEDYRRVEFSSALRKEGIGWRARESNRPFPIHSFLPSFLPYPLSEYMPAGIDREREDKYECAEGAGEEVRRTLRLLQKLLSLLFSRLLSVLFLFCVRNSLSVFFLPFHVAHTRSPEARI